MKDEIGGKAEIKTFIKSSKAPATTGKSFIKPSANPTSASTKKLATTLESDEFEMEKKQTISSKNDDYDDYDVNIGEENDYENNKLKDQSMRYSDDFEDSKKKNSTHSKHDNNNYNSSMTFSSVNMDRKNSFEKKEDEYGEEEMSEQASSSKPSQQSVIQKTPTNSKNFISKWKKR